MQKTRLKAAAIGLGLAGLVMLAGCATSSDIESLRADVAAAKTAAEQAKSEAAAARTQAEKAAADAAAASEKADRIYKESLRK